VAATIAALEALDADTRRLLENEFDQSAGEVEINSPALRARLFLWKNKPT
jgi:hypothetical protein